MEMWLLHSLGIEMSHTSRSHLKDTQLLEAAVKMLVRIDPPHFSNLANPVLQPLDHFKLILTSIEEYLSSRELHKLKRQFLVALLQHRKIEDLIAVVLYVSVNSSHKSSVVADILKLPEQDQEHLMDKLKHVDNNCDRLVSVKDIVERIEGLEQEGQELRQLYSNEEQRFVQQVEDIDELQLENAQLNSINQLHLIEKETVLDHCRFYSMQEYSQSSLQLKQEVKLMRQKIEESAQENQTLRAQATSLKKQLGDCTSNIKEQIQEVERLRNRYLLVRDQSLLRKESSQSYQGGSRIESASKLPLGGNISLLNIEQIQLGEGGGESGRSKDKEATDCTCYTEIRDDFDQSFEIRTPLSLQLQLTHLQQQHLHKTSQLHTLQSQLGPDRTKKSKLGRKITKIKNLHQEQVKLFGM